MISSEGATRANGMSDYYVILQRRIDASSDQWEEVHRESVTPHTLTAFRSGDMLRRAELVDEGGLMCMVRVELVAPDGATLDTYVGPHPDEGPEIYRQVTTAGRRSIANVWTALVTGADPGPVPDAFLGDTSEAAAYVAQYAREMR